jgi:hypothetical protein
MAIPVRSKEFSAGSPLDFAQLNDMVKDIIQLANSITVIDVGNNNNNNNNNVADATKTTSTVLGNTYYISSVPVLSKTKFGREEFVPFEKTLENGTRQAVSFVKAPRVVCTARTGAWGSGLCLLNMAGEPTTDGFKVRVGSINRTTDANVVVEYMAIGVLKS